MVSLKVYLIVLSELSLILIGFSLIMNFIALCLLGKQVLQLRTLLFRDDKKETKIDTSAKEIPYDLLKSSQSLHSSQWTLCKVDKDKDGHPILIPIDNEE